jgi:HSP20 family protein
MSTILTRRTGRQRNGLSSIFATDPFGRLRDEFDQMLTTWFSDQNTSPMSSFAPSLDLSETETNYVVKVDLPGIQPNEINVQVSDNVLTISGERKFEKTDGKEKEHENKNGTSHFVERFHGTFSRSIVMPGAVKQKNIDATYRDGVLTISLPNGQSPISSNLRRLIDYGN